MNENVFGVSGEGNILWQIERISEATYPACEYKNLSEGVPDTLLRQLERYPEYKGLSQYYRPDTFVAWNWNGTVATVDVSTGKVLKTFFLK